jgi:hypothetical protein
MSQLDDILTALPGRHAAALRWFAQRAGTVISWPRPLDHPDGDTLLASKAKGIYKPEWSPYALSVRQNLHSKYTDREPMMRGDQTWLYSYFQENNDPMSRDTEYTNRGMISCWQDRVPVGVMRQVSSNPRSQYNILGLAFVSGWDGGYFFLEGVTLDGHARPPGPAGQLELLSGDQERVNLATGSFDPNSVIDARERIVASIIRRRGQPDFRRRLLSAYDGCCAISGCNAVDALEAAHITPYRGPHTNCVQNGLLLRADLHTLFDLGLLAIDASTMSVLLSSALATSEYASLSSTHLRLPTDPELRPTIASLTQHRQWSGI